jgi:hypothetical protein
MDDRDELVRLYFKLGFSQKEMLYSLAAKHRIIVSLRHLKRILKQLALYRRIHTTSIMEVALFIVEKLHSSGALHGYRWMHARCLENYIVVSNHTVRHLLGILDPNGVQMRQRRKLQRRIYRGVGPNFTWHTDCYDKLKPYGICISGCIDGFSRKIIWLQAHYTSSKPEIIAGYFIEAVVNNVGCPRRVRADRGTENVIVKDLQTFLRRNHRDNLSDGNSFVYGWSIANQRIEAWWCILRKKCSQFWMNLFSELKDNGEFTGNLIDKNLIQFCFMALIQVS